MDLVTFIEEICNGKLHFLCSEIAELKLAHYVKSVQLRSFFYPNTGKYGPEKALHFMQWQLCRIHDIHGNRLLKNQVYYSKDI